jgi:hypothetical protein
MRGSRQLGDAIHPKEEKNTYIGNMEKREGDSIDKLV